jgi:hypothetical protein
MKILSDERIDMYICRDSWGRVFSNIKALLQAQAKLTQDDILSSLPTLTINTTEESLGIFLVVPPKGRVVFISDKEAQ